MKPWAAAVAAMVTLAICSVAAGPTLAQGARPETRASYLFVFDGRNADLKRVDGTGKSLELTVPLRGQNQRVTWFTDRPVRDAGQVRMKDFVGLWQGSGRDSFRQDPPNVAVSFDGATLIATMTNPRIVDTREGGHALVATLTLVRGQALADFAKSTSGIAGHAKRVGDNQLPPRGRIRNVSVFVDISSSYFNCPDIGCSTSEGTEVA